MTKDINYDINESLFYDTDCIDSDSKPRVVVDLLIRYNIYDLDTIVKKCCEIYKKTTCRDVKISILQVLREYEISSYIIDNLWDELYNVYDNDYILDEIAKSIECWGDKRFIPMLDHFLANIDKDCYDYMYISDVKDDIIEDSKG